MERWQEAERDILKLSRQHGRQKSSVRIQLVKPASPERGHCRVRNSDTGERREHETKERVEQDGHLDARGDGGNELTEGNTEEYHKDDDK